MLPLGSRANRRNDSTTRKCSLSIGLRLLAVPGTDTAIGRCDPETAASRWPGRSAPIPLRPGWVTASPPPHPRRWASAPSCFGSARSAPSGTLLVTSHVTLSRSGADKLKRAIRLRRRRRISIWAPEPGGPIAYDLVPEGQMRPRRVVLRKEAASFRVFCHFRGSIEAVTRKVPLADEASPRGPTRNAATRAGLSER
jgi:hypothetical protein